MRCIKIVDFHEKVKMYGQGYNPYQAQAQANLQEAVTDAWINQNVPGGVNSKLVFSFGIFYD